MESLNINSPDFRKWFMWIVITLMVVLLLTSCKSQKTKCFNQLKKIEQKCPDLFTTQSDTLIIEVPKVDTVIKRLTDTVYLSDVTEVITYKRDTVVINGNKISCDDCLDACIDSVQITTDCPDNKVITKKEFIKVMPTVGEMLDYLLNNFWYVPVILIILWLGIRFIKQRIT